MEMFVKLSLLNIKHQCGIVEQNWQVETFVSLRDFAVSFL